MLYEISRLLAAFLFKLVFRFEVEGKDSIPKHTSFILASNHLSYLDPIVLGIACPRKLYFLAKQELFRNKLISFFLKRVDAIPLRRGKTDVLAIKSALQILGKGKPLVIFPQGTRDQMLTKVFPGVGYLFMKTDSPVVISRISGTDKILPKGRKFLRPHRIKVIFKKIEGLKKSDSYEVTSCKVLDEIKNT